MRGYIKNGLNIIKFVIFMVRKYGKIIKLVEYRNERILNIFGFLIEIDKE